MRESVWVQAEERAGKPSVTMDSPTPTALVQLLFPPGAAVCRPRLTDEDTEPRRAQSCSESATDREPTLGPVSHGQP